MLGNHMSAEKTIRKRKSTSVWKMNYCRKYGFPRGSMIYFKTLSSVGRVETSMVRKALSQEIYPVGQPGHTLGRSSISGSKRKLWRQKGTGRARAGSKTGPLWKGGGVVFGPRGGRTSGTQKRNKKLWKAALNYVLYDKLKHDNLVVMLAPWDTNPFKPLPSRKVLLKGLRHVLQDKSWLFVVPNGTCLVTYRRAFFEDDMKVTIRSRSTVKCIDILRAEKVALIVGPQNSRYLNSLKLRGSV